MNKQENLKMGETMYKQFSELFFLPEIKKRQEEGRMTMTVGINRMQVIFFPEIKPPLIRLNNEVAILLNVKPKPGIKITKGQMVSLDEIDEITKFNLIEEEYKDCGHITFLLNNGLWDILFDFRYNKGYALEHLKIAKEFYEAAKFSISKNSIVSFIDNLFSSAELLAKSELLLLPDENFRKKTNHEAIKTKFNRWYKLGNVNKEFKDTLNRLSNLRPEVRYLQKEKIISDEENENFLNVIKEWIEYVEYLLNI